jgi:hypothetical protein
MLFEHDAHDEFARTRNAQLLRTWSPPASPAKRVVGTWLIHLGQHLAPDPAPRQPSALAHEPLARRRDQRYGFREEDAHGVAQGDCLLVGTAGGADLL